MEDKRKLIRLIKVYNIFKTIERDKKKMSCSNTILKALRFTKERVPKGESIPREVIHTSADDMRLFPFYHNYHYCTIVTASPATAIPSAATAAATTPLLGVYIHTFCPRGKSRLLLITAHTEKSGALSLSLSLSW